MKEARKYFKIAIARDKGDFAECLQALESVFFQLIATVFNFECEEKLWKLLEMQINGILYGN